MGSRDDKPQIRSGTFFVKGEKIVLRRDGTWIADGIEITHEPTREIFSKAIAWDAQERKYCLKIGYETMFIEVEDTPFFVTSLDPIGKGRHRARLSSKAEVELQASRLSYENETLYLALDDGLRAKFLSAPYYDLLRGLEEDKKAYFVTIAGERANLALKASMAATPETNCKTAPRSNNLARMDQNIYDFKVKTIDGKETSLEDYRGKALLIVNVASKCGFTPQYEGLEKLHRELGKQGLEILGFPCNQFGSQEPGEEAEIKSFCSLTYGVTFPMFSKIDVNGPNAHPLYGFLKKKEKGILGTEAIKWNFTKFLVDRKGEVLKRYAPTTKPEELRKDIESVLKS